MTSMKTSLRMITGPTPSALSPRGPSCIPGATVAPSRYGISRVSKRCGTIWTFSIPRTWFSNGILIYANSHMESGETLLRLGRGGEGVAELQLAQTIAPDLTAQVSQILRGYGM